MANLSGTIIAAAVRPTSDADTYATAYANEVNGGHHTAATVADMLKITKPRRAVGMFCYVEADKKVYQLINEPGTDATQETDWEVFSSGDVNSIEVSPGITLKDKLDSVDAALYNKFGIFIISDANKEGVNSAELTVPFKANLKALSMSLPSEATVTNTITANIYYYNSITKTQNNGKGALFGTVSITAADGVIFKAEDPIDVEIEANTILKCEMVSVQSDIKNIQITVQMKML